MSQNEGLQKELQRVRMKARILEKLIDLRCDVRDCAFNVPIEEGWKSPHDYKLAISFEAFGGNKGLVQVGSASFVVYGENLEKIREAALFFAAQKYGSSSLHRERVESQSQIGRTIDFKGEAETIVGIFPQFINYAGDSVKETMYVSESGHFYSQSQIEECPDFDWMSVDLDWDGDRVCAD